jgi:hypothetical protein
MKLTASQPSTKIVIPKRKEHSMSTSTQPGWRGPSGTINIFDPSALNWLFITWNTMEEPIRIDQEGRTKFALAEESR